MSLSCHNVNLALARNWRLLITLLTPLLFSPLINLDNQHGGQKFRCLYVIAIMGIYWCVEALPLPVTSLMPIALFPLLGLRNTKEVTVAYMRETNMLFLGGLMVAIAFEYSNLHRRIALKIILSIGVTPKRLMFGLMLVTSIFSMWISNTATAAMMAPIAISVLSALNENEYKESRITASMAKIIGLKLNYKKYGSTIPIDEIAESETENVERDENDDEEPRRSLALTASAEKVADTIKKVMDERKRTKVLFLLAIAYSANIGGTGTLTGSPPNLVLEQLLIKYSQEHPHIKDVSLSFGGWMVYAIPPMLVNLIMTFTYLNFLLTGLRENLALETLRENKDHVKMILKQRYIALGKMTFHEKAVLVLFLIILALWLLKKPMAFPGWGQLFLPIKIGDATPAMLIVILLFVIPKDLSSLRLDVARRASGGLLDWKFAQAHVPWGVILLMGAGFAISDAADSSGLSAWLGTHLSSLRSIPVWFLTIILSFLTSFATEAVSNTAVSTIINPVLISLSTELDLNPRYLTLPATIACSFAFMLPAATPPNAIVFGAVDMKMSDMISTGWILNFFCIIILLTFHLVYAELIFFHDYLYNFNVTGQQ